METTNEQAPLIDESYLSFKPFGAQFDAVKIKIIEKKLLENEKVFYENN